MLDAHLNRRVVVVAQTVRGGAAAVSVVGSAVGRFERRGRGLGSLSRFGDGVDQSVVAAFVASGMRRPRSTKRRTGVEERFDRPCSV